MLSRSGVEGRVVQSGDKRRRRDLHTYISILIAPINRINIIFVEKHTLLEPKDTNLCELSMQSTTFCVIYIHCPIFYLRVVVIIVVALFVLNWICCSVERTGVINVVNVSLWNCLLLYAKQAKQIFYIVLVMSSMGSTQILQ